MRLSLLSIFILLVTSVACGDNLAPTRTIADHVRAGASFSSLEAALGDAELLETLDGPGPFTLFAFRNGTFDPNDLEAGERDQLLRYHIHEGELSAAQLEKRTAITSLEGGEIHVRYGLDGILLNDGSSVGDDSIVAENGIIHVIDRALFRTLITETRGFEGSVDLPLEGFTFDVITIAEGGYVHDLEVSLEIQDADVSNLYIYLQNLQSGQFITLLESPRSNLNDVNVQLADSSDHDLVFDVVSEGDPGDKAFPRLSYRPVDPLEFMVGQEVAGEWELSIYNFGEDQAKGEVSSYLRSWSMRARIGQEPPAKAIVFAPRRQGGAVLGRDFQETSVVELRRVGGLAGEIELTGNAGEIASEPNTLLAEQERGALVFAIPADAEPGARTLTISAKSGSTSRIFYFDATVAQPQSAGIKLLSQIPLPQLGSVGGSGNDIWGWTDPSNQHEIAIIGTSVGTAFVDITQPSQPAVLGILPTATGASTWRDIKVYQDHAYIVSEARNHGMQIFDLTQLRGVSETQALVESARVDIFGNAHNIAINEETGTAYVVGSDYDDCDGGMLVLDISSPLSPVAISCFSGAVTNAQAGGPFYPTDVYTHDVQCVSYAGPDTDYAGNEICFSSDQDSIGIADFSDRANPTQIVRETYASVGYTHQGWLTEDHKFFILNDEFDEVDLDIVTRSYVWDVSDLDDPELVGVIDNPSTAVGHNTYIADGLAHQANYTSGLRVIDLSDLEAGNTEEIAYYDTYPDDDARCNDLGFCGTASYDGAWSVYPFFASGVLVVSDIQRGLFVLETSDR